MLQPEHYPPPSPTHVQLVPRGVNQSVGGAAQLHLVVGVHHAAETRKMRVWIHAFSPFIIATFFLLSTCLIFRSRQQLPCKNEQREVPSVLLNGDVAKIKDHSRGEEQIEV